MAKPIIHQLLTEQDQPVTQSLANSFLKHCGNRSSRCYFTFAVAVWQSLTIAGCYETLAPAVKPTAQIPRLDMEPAPPDPTMGRVAFDGAQGVSEVEEILAEEQWHGTYVAGNSIRTRTICVSPCVVNLPYGTYRVKFLSREVANLDDYLSHGGDATVTVGAQPSVVRYAPGFVKRGSMASYVAGLTALTLGPTAILTAPAFYVASKDSSAGNLTLIAGLAVTALGWYFMHSARTITKPGTSLQWTPTDGRIYAPAR
jgi:hypothetical protein